jgi:hypothetical protein
MNKNTTESAIAFEPNIEFNTEWEDKRNLIIKDYILSYNKNFALIISTQAQSAEGVNISKEQRISFVTRKAKSELICEKPSFNVLSEGVLEGDYRYVEHEFKLKNLSSKAESFKVKIKRIDEHNILWKFKFKYPDGSYSDEFSLIKKDEEEAIKEFEIGTITSLAEKSFYLKVMLHKNTQPEPTRPLVLEINSFIPYIQESDQETEKIWPVDSNAGRIYDAPDEIEFIPQPAYPASGILKDEAEIGVLLKGFSVGMGYLCQKIKEPISWIAVTTENGEFSLKPLTSKPRELFSYKILIIPSFGLSGIDTIKEFKDILSDYVNQGGILIAYCQQQGKEYEALPGNEITGYGSVEDQSCWGAACYVSKIHPIVSAQRSKVECYVDGYFTHYPKNSELILRRVKNDQPTLIMYRYGKGYVFVTSLYTDYGIGINQYYPDEVRLFRDLILWCKYLPQEIPTIKTIQDDFEFEIKNHKNATSTLQYLFLYTPDKELFTYAVVNKTILPNESVNLNFKDYFDIQRIINSANWGIWQIVYSVSTSTEYAVAKHFALINKDLTTEKVKALSFSVQSDFEYVIAGYPAEFKIIVWNNSDKDREITAGYSFPHHYWTTNDASLYGGDHIGNKHLNLKAKLKVKAKSFSAESVYLSKPIHNSNCTYDRIWVYFYDEEGKELFCATRGFYTIKEPNISFSIQPEKEVFYIDEVPNIIIKFVNNENTTLRYQLKLNITRPDNEVVEIYNSGVVISAQAETKLEIPYIPQPIQGEYKVTAELTCQDHVFSKKETKFNYILELSKIKIEELSTDKSIYGLAELVKINLKIKNIQAGDFNCWVRIKAKEPILKEISLQDEDINIPARGCYQKEILYTPSLATGTYKVKAEIFLRDKAIRIYEKEISFCISQELKEVEIIPQVNQKYNAEETVNIKFTINNKREEDIYLCVLVELKEPGTESFVTLLEEGFNIPAKDKLIKNIIYLPKEPKQGKYEVKFRVDYQGLEVFNKDYDFYFYLNLPEIEVNLTSDKYWYEKQESVYITFTVTNKTNKDTKLKVIIDVDETWGLYTGLYHKQYYATITSNSAATFNAVYKIPEKPRRILYRINTYVFYYDDVLYKKEFRLSYKSKDFWIPKPQPEISFLSKDLQFFGTSCIQLVVENKGKGLLDYAYLDFKLINLKTNIEVASITTPIFSIKPFNKETFTLSLYINDEFSFSKAYQLRYRLINYEGVYIEKKENINNQVAIEVSLNKRKYKVRENVFGTLTINNLGDFKLNTLLYTIKIPEIQTLQNTTTVLLSPYKNYTFTFTYKIPTNTYPKLYKVLASLYEQNSYESIYSDFTFCIPEAEIETEINKTEFKLDETCQVNIINKGGVDTQCEYFFSLTDNIGKLCMLTGTGSLTCYVDKLGYTELKIPTQLKEGDYTLLLNILYHPAWDKIKYKLVKYKLFVDGVKASFEFIGTQSSFYTWQTPKLKSFIKNLKDINIEDSKLEISVYTPYPGWKCYTGLGKIRDLCRVGDKLYLATDAGVKIFHINTGEFEELTIAEGLISNDIYSLTQDTKNHSLYIGGQERYLACGTLNTTYVKAGYVCKYDLLAKQIINKIGEVNTSCIYKDQYPKVLRYYNNTLYAGAGTESYFASVCSIDDDFNEVYRLFPFEFSPQDLSFYESFEENYMIFSGYGKDIPVQAAGISVGGGQVEEYTGNCLVLYNYTGPEHRLAKFGGGVLAVRSIGSGLFNQAEVWVADPKNKGVIRCSINEISPTTELNQVNHYTCANTPSLLSDIILDIETYGGVVYLATPKGVNYYYQSGEGISTWGKITKEDGLPYDYVEKLLVDDEYIWFICCDNESLEKRNYILARYKKEPAGFVNYTIKDGLPSNYINEIKQYDNLPYVFINTDKGKIILDKDKEEFIQFIPGISEFIEEVLATNPEFAYLKGVSTTIYLYDIDRKEVIRRFDNNSLINKANSLILQEDGTSYFALVDTSSNNTYLYMYNPRLNKESFITEIFGDYKLISYDLGNLYLLSKTLPTWLVIINKSDYTISKFQLPEDIYLQSFADNEEYILFLTPQNIYKFDKMTKQSSYISLTQFIPQDSIINKEIYNIGDLFYIITGRHQPAVLIINPKSFAVYKKDSQRIGSFTYTTSPDKKYVWFAIKEIKDFSSWYKQRIYRYDVEEDVWYSFNWNFPDAKINRISAAKDCVFLGSKGCGLFRFNKNYNLVFSKTYKIQELKENEYKELETLVYNIQNFGKFYVEGKLYNKLSQLLAKDDIYFYVKKTNLYLTLDYAFNQKVDKLILTIKVINDSTETISFLDLAILKDKTLISKFKIDNLPGNSYKQLTFEVPFGTQTTSMEIEVILSKDNQPQASVREYIIIPKKDIEVKIDVLGLESSNILKRGTYTFIVTLKNIGNQEVDIKVYGNILGDERSYGRFILQVGSITYIQDYFTPVVNLRNAYIKIRLEGDIQRVYTKLFEFGERIKVNLYPKPIYPEGVVEVPFSVVNEGKISSEFELLFRLTKENVYKSKSFHSSYYYPKLIILNKSEGTKLKEKIYLTKSLSDNNKKEFKLNIYLPINGSITAKLIWENLTQGSFNLYYEYFMGTGNVKFKVAKYNLAKISKFYIQRHGTYTYQGKIELENIGANEFSGKLCINSELDLSTNTINIKNLNKYGTFTFLIDLKNARIEEYPIRILLYNLLGEVLATTTQYLLIEPKLNLCGIKDYTLYPGTTNTISFAIENLGNTNTSCFVEFDIGEIYKQKFMLYDILPYKRRFIKFLIDVDIDTPKGLYNGILSIYYPRYKNANYKEIVELPIYLEGIDIEVKASLDKPSYLINDQATFTLTIKNKSKMKLYGLYAVVNPPEYKYSIKTNFDIDEKEEKILVFNNIKIKKVRDNIFYGIYHNCGRSLYLGTKYINERLGTVSIKLDKEYYYAGEILNCFIRTKACGTCTLNCLNQTKQIRLATDTTYVVSFLIPKDVLSGYYKLNYEFINSSEKISGMISGIYHFKVLGYTIRLIDSFLDAEVYHPKEIISLGIRLDVNIGTKSEYLSGKLFGYIQQPSGRFYKAIDKEISLTSGQMLICATCTLTSQEYGIHNLSFAIHKEDSVLCAGSEYFKVCDVIPPVSCITKPLPEYASHTLRIKYKAWDNLYGSGISKVSLYYKHEDDENYILWAEKTKIQGEFEFIPSREGLYSIYTQAEDKENNVEKAETQSYVYIDLTPPKAEVIYPTETFVFSEESQQELIIKLYDKTGGWYEIYLDNTLITLGSFTHSATINRTLNLCPKEEKEYDLHIKLEDIVGNYTEYQINRIFVYDMKNPEIKLIKPTEKVYTNKDTIYISFECKDISGYCEYKINISDLITKYGSFSCVSKTEEVKLSLPDKDGVYDLSICVKDKLNRESKIEKKDYIVVDRTNPVVNIAQDKIYTNLPATVTIRFTIDEPYKEEAISYLYHDKLLVATGTCDLKACLCEFNLKEGLIKDGLYSLVIEVKDKAGNISKAWKENILIVDTQSATELKLLSPKEVVYTNQAKGTICFYFYFKEENPKELRLEISTLTYTKDVLNSGTLAFSIGYDLPEGMYSLFSQLIDKAGNKSIIHKENFIYIDTTKPLVKEILINQGTPYTRELKVNVSLKAEDNLSGIDKVILTDGIKTLIYSYNPTYDYEFEFQDKTYGTKTLYAKLIDKAGNESLVEASTIIYETNIPYCKININNGAKYTTSTEVFIKLEFAEDVQYYRFSTQTLWIPYTKDIINYKLEDKEGTQTVYCWVKDYTNLENCCFAKIILDKTLPKIEEINLSQYINKDYILIKIKAYDNYKLKRLYINQCCYDIKNTIDEYKYELKDKTDGTKSISLVVEDEAGWQAQVYQTYFILDKTKPLINLISPKDKVYIKTGDTLNIRFHYYDLTAKSFCISLGKDNILIATGSFTYQAGTINLQPVITKEKEGEYDLLVELEDKAGNKSTQTLPGIVIIDNTKPWVRFNTKFIIATSSVVNLSWQAEEDVKRFYVYKNKTILATTTSLSFADKNLSEGKIIYEVTTEDKAGNLSEPAILEVLIDLKPPQIKSNEYKNDFIKENKLVYKATITDTSAGIKQIEFRLYKEDKLILDEFQDISNIGSLSVVYEYCKDINSLGEGNFYAQIKAKDFAERISIWQDRFKVDLQGAYIKAKRSCEYYTNDINIKYTGTLTDTFGVKALYFSYDDINYQKIEEYQDLPKNATFSVNLNLSWDKEGTYTVYLKAIDLIDRESIYKDEFVLDLTKPRIEIIQPKDVYLIQGTLTIQVMTKDEYPIRYTKLEVQEYKTQTTNNYIEYELLLKEDGTLTLSIQAQDLAGNESFLIKEFFIREFVNRIKPNMQAEVNYKQVRLSIPKGSFDTDVYIVIEKKKLNISDEELKKSRIEKIIAGVYQVEIKDSAGNNIKPKLKVVMQISYDKEDEEEIEKLYRIYRYDEDKRLWEELANQRINTQNNIIEVNLLRFSQFIIGLKNSTSFNLDEVYCYPNPAVNKEFITFANLTRDYKIRIYDIAGTLIDIIERDNNITGKERWYVPAGSSSGIYIYIVTNKEGDKKVNKFVVIK